MFWQNQPITDTLYLVALLGWGIIVLLLQAVPGLIGTIWNAYKYRRIEAVGLYISRFFPRPLLNLGLDLGISLLMGTIVLAWARDNEFIENQWLENYRLLIYSLALSIGLTILMQLRRASFSFWAYVFMPEQEGAQLRQDLDNTTLFNAIALLPLSALSLVSNEGSIAGTILIALILLDITLRTVLTLRRLVGYSEGYIYLFLYLCTQELLPWVVIALAIF